MHQMTAFNLAAILLNWPEPAATVRPYPDDPNTAVAHAPAEIGRITARPSGGNLTTCD
jgi:hypothetical protein